MVLAGDTGMLYSLKNGDSYTSGHWGRWYGSSDGWY